MSDYDYLRKNFESLLNEQGINLEIFDDDFTEQIKVITSVRCGSLIAKESFINSDDATKSAVIRQLINNSINELKKHMEEVHTI